MIRAAAFRPVLLLCALACACSAAEVVVDFESAVPLQGDKANRVPRWEEKGVVFTLAHEPKTTKAKGMLMFFTHLSSGHKGIVCAMATEPIPVRATFPSPVSSVTVTFWGSTNTPAVLEAFDADGKVVDRAALDSVPARKSPGDPVPLFPMTVHAPHIAYIQFSGPREGEYLAADELRFTPEPPGNLAALFSPRSQNLTSAVTARSISLVEPVADARGSDRSRDREGAVSSKSTKRTRPESPLGIYDFVLGFPPRLRASALNPIVPQT